MATAITITQAQKKKWLRTLNAILENALGVKVVAHELTGKEMEDETALVAYELTADRREYRLALRADYWLPRESAMKPAHRSPHPIWTVELWSDPPAPEPADLIEKDHDIDFNIACVKLVHEIIRERCFWTLRQRRELPTLSDHLRLFLEDRSELRIADDGVYDGTDYLGELEYPSHRFTPSPHLLEQPAEYQALVNTFVRTPEFAASGVTGTFPSLGSIYSLLSMLPADAGERTMLPEVKSLMERWGAETPFVELL
jgi:hypothetical protein